MGIGPSKARAQKGRKEEAEEEATHAAFWIINIYEGRRRVEGGLLSKHTQRDSQRSRRKRKISPIPNCIITAAAEAKAKEVESEMALLLLPPPFLSPSFLSLISF